MDMSWFCVTMHIPSKRVPCTDIVSVHDFANNCKFYILRQQCYYCRVSSIDRVDLTRLLLLLLQLNCCVAFPGLFFFYLIQCNLKHSTVGRERSSEAMM